MVVTLSTDHADAQEDLGRLLHCHLWVVIDPVKVSGRILVGAAGGCDQLAHQLVVGAVARDRIADPLAEGPSALLAQILAVTLQQVAPLQGPVINKLLALHQIIDEAAALEP